MRLKSDRGDGFVPAESVTVPLLWWKLDSPDDMWKAFKGLHKEYKVWGTVGSYPVDADGNCEFRLQFSMPGSDEPLVGCPGEVVAAIGGFADVVSVDVFRARYPNISVPGVD